MTTPSTPRKAGPLNGTGAQTAWPFTFKVFAESDISVTIADSDGAETVLVLDSDYSVSLNANQETSPGGTVTYPISGTALPVGSVLSIVGDLDYDQPLDLPSGGNFSPTALENQLDRAVMQIQQLKEQVDRSAKLPVTNAGDAAALVTDIVRLADSADNLDTIAINIAAVTTVASDLNEPVSEINTVAGAIANVDTVGANIANINTVAGISANVTSVAGNAANINAVAGNATNINAVNANAANIDAVAGNATNINTVATNIAAVNTTATNMAAVIAAPSEAAAAAASAAAAAASAASGMYSAVQDKSADYTVLAADAGDLIRVTTTGGARTITLPAISGVPDGFNITVVKWTGDANSVTVVRSGADTINGSASYVLDAQYKSATFVADAQTATWFAAGSGGAGSNIVVDSFDGTGAQTAFTLSGDPGSENNTQVFVSGVYQEKDTYSLSGATLTFSAAPPLGTSNIEVVWSQPLAIGVPGDGTVSAVKMAAGAAVANIADGALATAKLADGSVTAAKLAPGVLDALLVHGQCYLAKSGANLVLSPKNGNRLVINGASYAIPAAGVSLAPTGTAADTNYNIFAYMNSGVMTLEYSTTGHSADATTGVEIKTGDATRTYVGKARTMSAGAWVDDASHIYVLSWFNPKRKVGFASFTATRTVASGASAVEVNSEIRVFWLSHGIEPPDVLFTGGQFVTGAATGSSAVRLDGVTIGISLSICSSTGTTDMGINDNGFMPSEGDHYTTLFSSASGGTSISYIGGGNGAVTQQVIVNG